jgi:hypothetical protein
VVVARVPVGQPVPPWYLVRLRSGKLCAQTYLRERGRKKAMFLECFILGRQNIRFRDNDEVTAVSLTW